MFGKKSDSGFIKTIPGVRIKTLNYGSRTLMTEFRLTCGHVLPEHTHPHEQSGYLVSGKIKLRIGERSEIMDPGDSWNVPPDIPHSAEILEDSIALEVFSPCRDEYLQYSFEDDII